MRAAAARLKKHAPPIAAPRVRQAVTEWQYIEAAGSEAAAVGFENKMLQLAKQLLPQCARDVLDGRGATPQYWAWLAVQFERNRNRS